MGGGGGGGGKNIIGFQQPPHSASGSAKGCGSFFLDQLQITGEGCQFIFVPITLKSHLAIIAGGSFFFSSPTHSPLFSGSLGVG